MLLILYPLEPKGHISRTADSSQNVGHDPGAIHPRLCHTLAIHRENFTTGFITVQILWLLE